MHGTTTRRARTLTQATTSVCLALIESLEDRRLMSFSSAVNYPAGTSPQDVVRGDFNGDARPDLAVTNYADHSVSVLLGNADGTFQAALTSATGEGPQSAAVGDFNADGKLDLATSNSSNLSVLLGNGNGTFQAPTPLGVEQGATPAGVAVGDFNADGKLDLAAAANVYYPGGGYYGYGHYGGRFNLLLGNGTGSFAAATGTSLNTSNMVNSVAAADFNGDGKLDVATADNGYFWGGAHPVVSFGNGAGGLGTATHLAPSSGASPQSVSAGDVNGDGKADLIGVNTYHNTVDVLLANGTGGFAAAQPYIAGTSPSSAELGDFNGDAKVDLITANTGGGSVSVLLGDGTGVFRPPAQAAVATQPVGVAVGDFNGDGRTDAAAANSGSANVSVLLNDGNWPSVNAPFITVNDVTVTEGHGGTVDATLTVSLSAPSAQTVTVKYATTDGSAAAADDDYNAVAATPLTFAPGEVSKQITVQVRGDRVAELTETFDVVLSEATNAFVGDATGSISITDDEPRVTIDDVSAAEGNSGTKSFTFTLHLSTPAEAPVSVDYSTFEGDTDYWPYNPYAYYYYGPPAATAGTDFVAKTGTATFAVGETSTTVTVVVNGDRDAEQDEAFSLDLSGASGAQIDDGHAVGTIANDEPFASVSGGSVTEGNSGTQLLPFTITLSGASDVAVTVDYLTSNGTATAGGDYAAKSGSVTFAPGETSKTVNVTVNGDRLAEGDESFSLILTTATNAGVATGQASGTIVDNEPTISINSVSTTEGNSGSKLLTFTVTLSAAYDQTVTVGYATQNGTARSGKDYTAASGTLTFLAGQTTKTFTISIKGEKQREPDEWFNVVLRSPSANARIGNGIGRGTILNDDFR